MASRTDPVEQLLWDVYGAPLGSTAKTMRRSELHRRCRAWSVPQFCFESFCFASTGPHNIHFRAFSHLFPSFLMAPMLTETQRSCIQRLMIFDALDNDDVVQIADTIARTVRRQCRTYALTGNVVIRKYARFNLKQRILPCYKEVCNFSWIGGTMLITRYTA